MATATTNRKGTVKLNELLRIEQEMQEKWEREKVFEENAPEPGSADARSIERFLK